MKRSDLRAIPSVEKVMLAIGESKLARPVVIAAVRRELSVMRKQQTVPDLDVVLARVRAALHDMASSRLRPVINGTGIIVHTNFGRAPLGREVLEVLSNIGSNYNNLEYALAGGSRGSRCAYLEGTLALLCESEAATVVNNNAAALILILRHFCKSAATVHSPRRRGQTDPSVAQKNEVIISRGELIQIGGGFRIPEILESSGARLREVGTTNKTSLGDYARAITPQTALILKVHRSNFFMGGFVASPLTEQIAALASKRRIPFVEDLGSGAMIKTESVAGLEHESTPAEVLSRGVELVCFSGDKLLGGPQAGIIAGKARLVSALKGEPLFRALRCDKLILSALETTVDIYLREAGRDSWRCAGIPALEMMHVSNSELRSRGEKIISDLGEQQIKVDVGVGHSQIGGGTLPQSQIVSVTLDLIHPALKPDEIAVRLRDHTVPIIGYIARGKFKLDLRTVFPQQDAELVSAIRALSASKR